MAKSSTRAPQLVNVQATARERLLQVAMRLFAEHGVAGVSMREIGASAGNRNKSAVAYHFENKTGLINAITSEIQSFLEPRFDKTLSDLEARDPSKISIYEIGLALSAPLFALYASEPSGEFALKTLARFSHEHPENISDESWNSVVHIIGRVTKLILKLRPTKPLEQLKFHLSHYMMATVNGLSMLHYWEGADFRAEADLLFELLLSYTDYVSGGLSADEASRPQIDLDYWRRAITP